MVFYSKGKTHPLVKVGEVCHNCVIQIGERFTRFALSHNRLWFLYGQPGKNIAKINIDRVWDYHVYHYTPFVNAEVEMRHQSNTYTVVGFSLIIYNIFL